LPSKQKILVVGAGAAGYFCALNIVSNNSLNTTEQGSDLCIDIAETGSKPLQKVLISGGGRCNVTQGCFDIETLLKGYPRGSRELRSCFHKFQPRDIVYWFESRGVKLKKEADGRMFPISDSSKTIISCFESERKKYGINLLLKTKIISVKKKGKAFKCSLKVDSLVKEQLYDKVVLATGSSKSGYEIASSLGHEIIKPVPSLFTFKISDPRLEGLEGLSTQNAETKLISKTILEETGPILITHWGLSGPAIIKLSAWAARMLYESSYNAKLVVSWLPKKNNEQMLSNLKLFREKHSKKLVLKNPLADVPKRLWQSICENLEISDRLTYSELSKVLAKKIENEIFNAQYQIDGKGVFKEEFVTCGGVNLKEIDFRTMESKITPGLYVVGELLDIDGITGGYNFQSAWSTGYIAGLSIRN